MLKLKVFSGKIPSWCSSLWCICWFIFIQNETKWDWAVDQYFSEEFIVNLSFYVWIALAFSVLKFFCDSCLTFLGATSDSLALFWVSAVFALTLATFAKSPALSFGLAELILPPFPLQPAAWFLLSFSPFAGWISPNKKQGDKWLLMHIINKGLIQHAWQHEPFILMLSTGSVERTVLGGGC